MTRRIVGGKRSIGIWKRVAGPAVLLGSTLAVPAAAQAPVPDVTVTGCLVRQPESLPAPPVGHEQEAARGLSLSQVTMKADQHTTPPRSAIPGSLPTGSGSGTIPETSVRRETASEPQSFWLVGDKAIELARFVDRQAEVLGRFDERNAANPGDTVDADAGAVPERRSTAAPPPRPDPAHPSAPTRVLRVVSFRVLEQSCR